MKNLWLPTVMDLDYLVAVQVIPYKVPGDHVDTLNNVSGRVPSVVTVTEAERSSELLGLCSKRSDGRFNKTMLCSISQSLFSVL